MFNRHLVKRLRETIDKTFIDHINLVSDKEGCPRYYVRSSYWDYAEWNPKSGTFGLYSLIDEKLLDELFDKKNHFREDVFQLGYYDLFKDWLRSECRSLGKKLQKEMDINQRVRDPEVSAMHERVLRRILGD